MLFSESNFVMLCFRLTKHMIIVENLRLSRKEIFASRYYWMIMYFHIQDECFYRCPLPRCVQMLHDIFVYRLILRLAFLRRVHFKAANQRLTSIDHASSHTLIGYFRNKVHDWLSSGEPPIKEILSAPALIYYGGLVSLFARIRCLNKRCFHVFRRVFVKTLLVRRLSKTSLTSCWHVKVWSEPGGPKSFSSLLSPPSVSF